MKQFCGIIFICAIIQRSVSQNVFASVVSLLKNSVDQENIDDDEINGSGICSMVAGCKIPGGRRACYGPSGTNVCSDCVFRGKVRERNLMRADFYEFGTEVIKNKPFIKEMMEYMLLHGTGIARMPQGAVFHPYRYYPDSFDVPKLKPGNIYKVQFCDKKDCFRVLQTGCLQATLLPHIRNWCSTVLGLLEDKVDGLKGASSYVLFLAAKVLDRYQEVELHNKEIVCVDPKNTNKEIPCKWDYHNGRLGYEEKAVLAAAAASSVFLLGKWFPPSLTATEQFGEFGLAVHHSIWLAIYAGRLRVTLQTLNYVNYQDSADVPGTQTMCDEEDAKIADNYQGESGTAYAVLCTLFKTKRQSARIRFTYPNLRYRPEIHTRHSLGCVERTNGMIFLKPGDWITPNAQKSIIGSAVIPLGLQFYDKNNLKTLELTRTVTTLYPSSIAEAMKDQNHTICTNAKGNGQNYYETFGKAGLAGIGGMCNWVPVW